MFSMVSDLGKLKRKVDLLGSPKDTLSHRCAHCVREGGVRRTVARDRARAAAGAWS